MIPAFRAANTPTARTLEIVRMVLMFLVFFGLLMYPVELFLIGHWLPNWQAQIPFFLTVPALAYTNMGVTGLACIYRAR